ncbi:MAG: hemerythrin domain-containing protein, partial [Bdellovibrionota bacterium]
MDPLSTLIDQHKHIREHLEAVKKPGLARPKLLEELRSQLDFHMYLEECCVYPLLEDYDELQSQVFGFWAEHEHLRAELQQLLEAQQDEDLFQANLVSLGAFFEE